MKRIALVIALMLTVMACWAQKAEIKLDKTTFDFGTIYQSDGRVECEFDFQNVGEGPLVIVSAKSSCGCTTPHYPDAPIASGAKGKITLKFDPRNQFGEITKTVSVRTNDPKHRKIILRITGTVLPKK